MSDVAAPTFEFLDSLDAHLQIPGLGFLISAITSCALGHSTIWIPQILSHAYTRLTTPSGTSPGSSTKITDDAQLQAKKEEIFLEIKEALIKSAILVGIPKVIEASLTLKNAGHQHGVTNTHFLREDLEDLTVKDLVKRGDVGLDRVYKQNITGIFEMMGDELQDIKFLSRMVTYGVFISPIKPEAPLTMKQSEVVILSTLVAQRLKKEIHWHLRGCVRSGFSRPEVEAIQSAIELVGKECGVADLGKDMPRVQDVEPEPHEK